MIERHVSADPWESEQWGNLGTKGDSVSLSCPKEGARSGGITGQPECRCSFVPDGEGKATVEFVDHIGASGAEGIQQSFQTSVIEVSVENQDLLVEFERLDRLTNL